MSLSRLPVSDKGQLTSYQLLLELVKGISTLIEDPKALQKAADLAYTLDAESEQKAKTAYADIARADAAKQEAIKQQKLAADLIEEANISRADANSQVESIKKERKRLSEVDTKFGALALKLSNQETDLKDRESKLAAGLDDLQKQLVALAAKQKQLNEFEAHLKEKAVQLRSIVDA